MASFKINDQENAALDYLPYLAQLVYMRVLRRFMDFSSGVVGRSPKEISLGSISESLEVSSKYTANNKRGRSTSRQVRTALGQLERVGLIERLPGRRVSSMVETLVFKLPLAIADYCAPNSNVTVASQSRHTGGVTQGASCGAGFGGSDVAVESQSTNASGVIHPVSGFRKEVIDSAVVDSARADVDRDAVPRSPGEWFQFFTNVLGFRYEKTRSAKMAVAVDAWVRDGVSYGVVLDAVENGNSKCGGRPGSPVYYIGFVDDVLREGVSYEQRESNAKSGRGGKRVSAAERGRRQAIEYGRSRGCISDEEWEQYKRHVGEPNKADPFRAQDDGVVGADGVDVSESVAGANG